jgi:thioredoxin 1
MTEKLGDNNKFITDVQINRTTDSHWRRECFTMVEDISSDDLPKIVEDNKVVFVDCHAVWCGPCRTLGPILEELNDKYEEKGLKVVKLDVDHNREFSMENQITGVPSVLVYSEGKRVVFDDGAGRKMDKLVGVMPPEVYAQIADDLLAEEAA